MKCGILKNIFLLSLVFLLVQACISPAYSQDAVQSEDDLLAELGAITKRQATRIELLSKSLQERTQRIVALKNLLKKTKSSLDEMQNLSGTQRQIIAEQTRLFSNYEKISSKRTIEAGLLGGLGGVVLGFVGGIVGMYYIGK